VSQTEATIRVGLDPTNPGQFFACCGLLELADRLWGRAEGWFETADTFCLGDTDRTRTGTEPVIDALARCRLTNTMKDEEVRRLEELSRMTAKQREKIQGADEEKKRLEKHWREDPILLHEPFHLRVDWFLDDRAGGDRFKTWAGQQSVLDIALAMKKPLERGDWSALPPARWLSRTTEDEGLPFNFDSDLGGQASALDVGFSFDPLGLRSRTRPLIELAAFIGLQRFRPAADPTANRYRFSLWSVPLPPEIAGAAACGAVPVPGSTTFEFRLLYRTKYLKSFLPATPIGGRR